MTRLRWIVGLLVAAGALYVSPAVIAQVSSNIIQLVGKPSGQAPQLKAQGQDANISINAVPKGSGCFEVNGICVQNLTSVSLLATIREDWLSGFQNVPFSSTNVMAGIATWFPNIQVGPSSPAWEVNHPGIIDVGVDGNDNSAIVLADAVGASLGMPTNLDSATWSLVNIVRFPSSGDLVAGKVCVGFCGNENYAFAPLSPTIVSGYYFKVTNTASVGNWLCVARDNNVETAVDTGVAADLNWRKMELRNTSASLQCYVDDVLKATITTHRPGVDCTPTFSSDGNASCFNGLMVQSDDGSDKHIYWDAMEFRMEVSR